MTTTAPPDDLAAMLQQAKNEYAQSQDPPLAPCTNVGCKFTQCTCGNDCGCGKEGGKSCDPCDEFKRKKKAEMMAAAQKQQQANAGES